jgi:glutamate-5-semialdehyde dehydrogenase
MSPESIGELMEGLGKTAVAAAGALALAPTAQKNAALTAAALALRAGRSSVSSANERDLAAAHAARLPTPRLDRLKLDDSRIEAIAAGLEAVAALPDPSGAIAAQWQRPNGLRIERVVVPLRVIGNIYESRPTVTVDA